MTSLTNKIESIRGCNYYSIKTNEEYESKVNKEFELITTPILYDMSIEYKSDLDPPTLNIYGVNEMINKILYSMNTLFGINKYNGILIKLDLYDKVNDITFLLKYKNINYQNINKTITINFNYDNKTNIHFDDKYIRKMVLLTKYTTFIKEWIKYEKTQYKNKQNNNRYSPYFSRFYSKFMGNIYSNENNNKIPLKVSNIYKKKLLDFIAYFNNEILYINDNSLNEELYLLNKLLNYKNNKE